MKILIVAATDLEIKPLLEYFKSNWYQHSSTRYQYNHLFLEVLITGVGLTFTAYHLSASLQRQKPDLALNVGIAGAFNATLAFGEVVHVGMDRFGDLGIEEANGEFKDIMGTSLLQAQEWPFKEGWLSNPTAFSYGELKNVRGLSVNCVHGTPHRIEATLKRYRVDTESMEGAAFFYTCLLTSTPFFQIRAISNRVEPRNKANWNIPLAVQNLNEFLVKYLRHLSSLPLMSTS